MHNIYAGFTGPARRITVDPERTPQPEPVTVPEFEPEQEPVRTPEPERGEPVPA